MTTAIRDAESKLLELHGKFRAASSLLPLAEAAALRFAALRYPGKKHEMFTFARLNELRDTAFDYRTGPPKAADAGLARKHIYAGCDKSVIVMVDGKYDAGLSDVSGMTGQVSVVPLEQYASGEANMRRLVADIETETDVFACLNSMFSGGGVAVEIKKGARPVAPLQILHLSTGGAPNIATSPRVVMDAGADSSVQLIIRFAGIGEGYFVNSVCDLRIGEGAAVHLSQVQGDPARAWHFSKTRVFVAKDGRFDAVSASTGGRLARHHWECRLQGEGAALTLRAASILEGTEQAHHYTRVHHEKPNTTSYELYKNMLNGSSVSSVDTTVTVHPGAQLAVSEQLINNLMLSETAKANTKPNLTIFADDVKCKHGATVGRIDEAQVFYLMSRGLSEKLAKALLTTSFAKSVLNAMPHKPAAEDAGKLLLKKLEALGIELA